MTTTQLSDMGYRFEGDNGLCLALPGFAARYHDNHTSVYRYDPTTWTWMEVGKFPLFDLQVPNSAA